MARRGRAGRQPRRPRALAAGARRVSKAILTAVSGLALSWHPTPARLGVSATEFHLVLSRPSVKAGVVEIELQNDGQDPHDLRVRRVGGSHTFSIPLVQPGSRRTVAIHV